MKETKNIIVKARITRSEKEALEAYCAKHNWTISELIRVAINSKIKTKEM